MTLSPRNNTLVRTALVLRAPGIVLITPSITQDSAHLAGLQTRRQAQGDEVHRHSKPVGWEASTLPLALTFFLSLLLVER